MNIKTLKRKWTFRGIKLERFKTLYTARNYMRIIKFMERYFPEYVLSCDFAGKKLLSCPKSKVKFKFIPNLCLRKLLFSNKLDGLQKIAVELVKLLSTESGVPIEDFGLHGSIALEMHTEESDIDLVVYGSENFRSVERTFNKLVEEGVLAYNFKSKLDVIRKHRGVFMGIPFVYTAVRKFEEIKYPYISRKYKPIKPLLFKCRISDDSEAMFRPAIYKIREYQPLNENSELKKDIIPTEVASMIGLYRNVARKGEEIKVRGFLEKVVDLHFERIYYRVVVGSGLLENEYILPTSICG